MSNQIDLIVSKQAQAQLDELHKSLSKAHDEIIKINQNQITFNSGSAPKSINDLNKAIKESIKQTEELSIAERKLLTDTAKLERLKQAQMQSQIKEIALTQKQIAEKNKLEQAYNKEQAKLEASQSLYNKVQSKLNALSVEYKNLATRKELGLRLTEEEEKRYEKLQGSIQKYDKVLKGVDASMGKYQRNVGNYAGSFNPLSNSINQLGREAPAFANSMQTGFMAISNNLPIFFDAMGNVIAQNKELQAQGKPTESVLSQLASSLFSFQTLLTVGVTLLTFYGKELVNWAGSLFGASEALKSLNESQKEFNNSRISGLKDAQSEIVELKKYLAVVSDRKLSDEERNIALKKLKQEYPFYFKNLTDEQILLGQTKEAQDKLNIALGKRKQVEKATEINVGNKQRLIDLEKEIDLQEEITRKANIPTINDRTGLKQTDPILIAYEENKLKSLKETRKKYYDVIVKNESLIIKLKKETIGLEYQEDKVRKKKEQKQKATLDFDYLESEYKLKLARLNKQKDIYAEELKNENLSYEGRILARQRFSDKLIEILDLEAEKQKSIELIRLKDDLDKNNLAYKNKELSGKQYLENVTVLQKRYSNEIKRIDVETSGNFTKIKNEDYEYYAKIEKDKLQVKQNTEKLINELELKRLTRLKDDNTKTLAIRQQAFNENLSIQRKELDLAKIREIAQNPDKIDEIIAKYKLLNDELDNLVSPLKNAQIETDKWLNSLGNAKLSKLFDDIGFSSLNMFADFDEAGQSTFSKLLAGATTFREEMQVTFQAVSEVARDVFNSINKNSQENFDAEYSRLEQQKNISLKFAGDNADAKTEIERQYEERRKVIQRRQAEAEKRQAMFNIAINTAQAVMATLGKTGFAGIPLSVIVGAIGAAQLAMVASQEIPAFAQGGQHEGGLMLINDAKGSNYEETIVTPDGKAKQYKGRNVLVDAPKGTQIYTPEQWSKIGKSGNSGINKADLESVFSKYSNSQEVAININENGFKKMITSNFKTREVLNSRFNVKGRIV